MRSARAVTVAAAVAALTLAGCAGDEGGGAAPAPAASAPAPATTPAAGGTTTTKTTKTTTAGGGTAAPQGTTGKDAEATAAFYLRQELGMREPVPGRFKPTGGDTGEVGVRPKSIGEGGNTAGGPVTTVTLRKRPGGWTVTGARTPNIQVTSPKPGQTVTSPVKLTGKAHAFEGNVAVTVTANVNGRDPELGTTAVTGGGDALRAFDGKVTYKRRTGSGWVVFFTESAADGHVLEATIVPVRLG
jgi:hypothetical protein